MSDGVRFFSAGPLSVFAVILLVGLVILIIPLLILGMIGAAFTRLGFSWITAIVVVLLMLFGSYVNIPLYRIKRDMVRIYPDTTAVFGSGSPWPADPVWETLVSINLGGAILPMCISLYLLYQAVSITGSSLLVPVGSGILLVALVTFFATRPIPGVGLRVPLLIPALTALLMGMLLFGGAGIPATVMAFVSGTTGTLLGGNIPQLFRIKDLEVPFVSIGGAGTFGAVFICCIVPALVA
ncbi:MAG: DUF1614 domain-containing protein [Methanoregula sp.]|jgi:uncharacterized membrane protein|nr:DUF1614 domain-containing protein [Methanoregula sp.]